MQSAHKLVERYLKTGRMISQKQCTLWFGSSRLAPIIHRLRDYHEIVTVPVKGQKYCRYLMKVKK